MRNYKNIFALGALLALFASCAPKTQVVITVDGAPKTKLAVHKLGVGSADLMDSVKTDASGKAAFSVPVKKGQPEFFYVYKGDTKLASLLLEAGEKAVVKADTLGNYSVEGSEGSAELISVDRAYADFIREIAATTEPAEATGVYVRYYRDRLSYVLSHSKSLAVVPVMFQNLNPEVPVFSQSTDAIVFRSVTDSLKTVYPDSKYVKALEAETERRRSAMELQNALLQAQETGFPEISLPDINAQKVSLSGVEAKAILLHFWNSADAEQTLFNLDVLTPLYETYHKKGLEIYSVCITTDKAQWASVVRNQKLPWINVCDGYGASSPVVRLYNIQTLPSTILIANGEISSTSIKGESAIRKELSKLLK